MLNSKRSIKQDVWAPVISNRGGVGWTKRIWLANAFSRNEWTETPSLSYGRLKLLTIISTASRAMALKSLIPSPEDHVIGLLTLLHVVTSVKTEASAKAGRLARTETVEAAACHAIAHAKPGVGCRSAHFLQAARLPQQPANCSVVSAERINVEPLRSQPMRIRRPCPQKLKRRLSSKSPLCPFRRHRRLLEASGGRAAGKLLELLNEIVPAAPSRSEKQKPLTG